MQRSKRILLSAGIGLALAGGGVGFAAASSSSPSAAKTAGTATINVTTASVGGKSEQILVDAHGLPLYTFGSDTSTTTHVTGTLAVLWPPLVSAAPNESGAGGKLTVVTDAEGHQVQYNGHFLYTFVDDTPGQVTGQGVQGFSVASPGLSSGSASATPAPARNQSSGYGY